MIAKKFRAPRQKFLERPTNRANSDYFLFKIFKNDIGHNRFGVTISARVDKRSSRRNFWKRTILNFAGRQENFGKDILIVVSPRIRELSKGAAEQELEKMFKKIRQLPQ